MATVRKLAKEGNMVLVSSFKDFKNAYNYIRAREEKDVFTITEKGDKYTKQTLVINSGNGEISVQLLKKWEW